MKTIFYTPTIFLITIITIITASASAQNIPPEIELQLNQYHRWYNQNFMKLAFDQILPSEDQTISYEEFETIPLYTVHKIISDYDFWFYLYGSKFNVNWLLLASQAYQESRFNPQATSSSGAAGIMQIMPATARELGCQNPYSPEQNIAAAAKYLSLQMSKLSECATDLDNMAFALSAYNAGYGHTRDAIILAEKLGLNRNIWKDNVEKAFALLADNRYYSQSRYGYCNGPSVIVYVNEIIERYLEYRSQI